MPTISESRRRWWVLAAMAMPLFVLMVDFYGVVVTVPSIGTDLDMTPAQLGWVVNAFALGVAAPVLAFGRIADVVGRRRVVLVGMVGFGATSALCGLAPSGAVLVAARGAQGVAAAAVMATSLSLVSNAFAGAGARRALGIGLWGAIGGVGSSIGPLVGGLTSELLSWRWFFFVNLPVLAVAVPLTLVAVPESRDPGARRVDRWGALLATVGTVLVVVGLQQATTSGWGAPVVVAAVVAGVASLVGFLRLERSVREPLVDLPAYRSRAFAGPGLVAFLSNWAFGAVMFFGALYAQSVLGLDPLASGIVLVAFSVPFVVSGALSGPLVRRVGTGPAMAAGMVVVAVGAAGLAAAAGATTAAFVFGLAVSGLGQGTAYNVSSAAGLGAIPDDEAGTGAGVLSMVRSLGLALGVAVTGIVISGGGGPVAGAGLTTGAVATGFRAGMVSLAVVSVAGVAAALLGRSRAATP